MMTIQKAHEIRNMIEKAAASLADADAIEAVELFPAWAVGTTYYIGQRIRYEEKLYRCNQQHTAQADWTPDITPALWTEVGLPHEIPVWRQPTGAQDAYNQGDKVSHNDKHWISDLDANIWEPGVYGWSEA